MPRIRTIKPEFCTSEQVAECSTNARLLFVLMWCFCDDAGRHPANTKRLKMECFPGDTFSNQQMESMIKELISVNLLVEYTHDNARFWQVTGWNKHQRIDKPSFKYGPLSESGIPLQVGNSTNVLGMFDERSPPEGNGKEGSGEESKGEEGIDCGVGEKSPPPPPANSDFSFQTCDGLEWFLSLAKLTEYRKTFPELDLGREFRKASQWLRDNPKKRKTAKGMPAFLGSWLSRAQNSGAAAIVEKQKRVASVDMSNPDWIKEFTG